MFPGSLWVSIVLNPDRSSVGSLVSRLRYWSKLDVCPLEDPDYRHNTSSHVFQNETQTSNNSQV